MASAQKKAENTAGLLAGLGALLAAAAGIGPIGESVLLNKGFLVLAVVAFLASTLYAWQSYRLRKQEKRQADSDRP